MKAQFIEITQECIYFTLMRCFHKVGTRVLHYQCILRLKMVDRFPF